MKRQEVKEENKFVNSPYHLPYSRGGARVETNLGEVERLGQLDEQVQLMYTTAISSASAFGINLYPGVATRGTGDCLFEACIDQFLHNGFEKLTEREQVPLYWRHTVADLVENNITANKMYRMSKSKGQGTKQKQWSNEWAKLRQLGEFQCHAADLLVLGLATTLHKNILVFNTHSEALNPITVHLATMLGGSVTTDIPILLCYDQNHYEGLIPVSDEDQRKTVELVKKYAPKRHTATLDVICPIPGTKQKYDNENIAEEAINRNTRTGENESIDCMPPNKTYQLHLTNHGSNLCFSNSVVQLLGLMEIKSFVLTKIPNKPDPAIGVAQELKRLFRVDAGEDSTAKLRRYITC